MIASLKQQQVAQRNKLDEDYKARLVSGAKSLEIELKDSRLELAKIKREIGSQASRLKLIKANTDAECGSLNKMADMLRDEVNSLESALNELTVHNSEQENKKVTLQVVVSNLVSDRDLLTGEKSRLQEELDDLNSKLGAIKSKLDDMNTKYRETESQYVNKIDDYTSKYKQIESKYTHVAQKILDEQNSQQKVSDNLASWQKSLDERDRNLRIREQKVTQGESTILRNSDLLDL